VNFWSTHLNRVLTNLENLESSGIFFNSGKLREFYIYLGNFCKCDRGLRVLCMMIRIFLETRMFGLSDGEEIMTLAFFVLIQYRSVTDRQTDRHSYSGYTSACIACYANALVKTLVIFSQYTMVSPCGITT